MRALTVLLRVPSGAAVGPASPPAAALVARLVGVVGLGVHGIGVHHEATATAVLTRRGERLDEPGTELLAGHLHEAERGDLGDLVPGAVAAERLGETSEDQVAVRLQHHVDEVDHHHAADVAQPELTDDLLGRLEVVPGHGLLEVAPGAGELPGVDVDDRHRLGAVDHERAAGGQPHLAVERLGQLLAHPVRAEHVGPAVLPVIPVQAVLHLGRDPRHVLVDGLPRVVAFDHERGKVLVEQVADDLDQEVGLLVERDRGAGALRDPLLGRRGDLLPLGGESGDVAADLLLAHALGGGPDDHTRALRDDILEDRLEPLALGVRELAGDAGRVAVRHVDQEAARERDLRGQARTLLADRVLRHLDQHRIARAERLLDTAGAPAEAGRLPVDLTGVEDAVATPADVDERRLHAGEHVLHTAEVDVADHGARRLGGDEVLDQDAVLEDADLGHRTGTVGVLLLADHHDAIHGLATREELGLRQDRLTTTARLTAVAPALSLGLEPRRPADALDLLGAGSLGLVRSLARLLAVAAVVAVLVLILVLGVAPLVVAALAATTTAATSRTVAALLAGALLGVVRGILAAGVLRLVGGLSLSGILRLAGIVGRVGGAGVMRLAPLVRGVVCPVGGVVLGAVVALAVLTAAAAPTATPAAALPAAALFVVAVLAGALRARLGRAVVAEVAGDRLGLLRLVGGQEQRGEARGGLGAAPAATSAPGLLDADLAGDDRDLGKGLPAPSGARRGLGGVRSGRGAAGRLLLARGGLLRDALLGRALLGHGLRRRRLRLVRVRRGLLRAGLRRRGLRGGRLRGRRLFRRGLLRRCLLGRHLLRGGLRGRRLLGARVPRPRQERLARDGGLRALELDALGGEGREQGLAGHPQRLGGGVGAHPLGKRLDLGGGHGRFRHVSPRRRATGRDGDPASMGPFLRRHTVRRLSRDHARGEALVVCVRVPV